jgi:hypothetical protein
MEYKSQRVKMKANITASNIGKARFCTNFWLMKNYCLDPEPEPEPEREPEPEIEPEPETKLFQSCN